MSMLAEINKLYEVDQCLKSIKCDLIESVSVSVPNGMCQICASTKQNLNEICTCTIPISEFSEIAIQHELLRNITDKNRCGYIKPSQIQQYAIPCIDSGFDVIGCAPEGTWKTVAYMIPLMKMVLAQSYKKHTIEPLDIQTPEAIILAPAGKINQIHNCALKISSDQTQYSMVCTLRSKVGSSNQTEKQEARVGVRNGCNILIGTPGRVKTLLQRSTISLKNAGCFVLDDVEQLLEVQRFRRDVERIEGKFDMKHKSERQTLVFSTKFSQEIQQMAGLLMRDDYKLIKGGNPVANNVVSPLRH